MRIKDKAIELDRQAQLDEQLKNEPIDRMIRQFVSESPGLKDWNLIGQISDRIAKSFDPASPSLHVSDLHFHVKRRVIALAENAEITEVSIQATGNPLREIRYYPGGFTITTVPKQCLKGPDEPPKALSEPMNPSARALTDHIAGILRECPDAVRLHVVSKFCPRCGADAEGHFCNN